MCAPGQQPAVAAVVPLSAAEALAALQGGLAYLAADVAGWPGEALAGCLRASGRAESAQLAVAPPDADSPGGAGADDGFRDRRRVWLDLHFQGAGKLNGDLTPECAAALTAMLDALGKKAGPGDTRTASQRHHDALEEACHRWLPSCIMPRAA